MDSNSVKSYRDLLVWQKGMDLVEEIYKTTRTFPNEEKFGLCQQMNRAAVSVPSNIAEGHSRRYTTEFQRFILIAIGSISELETQIILSQRLNYIDTEKEQTILNITSEIGKMLNGLYNSLEKKYKKS